MRIRNRFDVGVVSYVHILSVLVASSGLISLVGCRDGAVESSVGRRSDSLEVAFAPAPSGCAMAHCDTRMSDWAGSLVPRVSTTSIVWHDPAPAGSRAGVGCSSNGTIVACSYAGDLGDNLVVYDTTGARRWTSGATLDGSAWTSAPLVASDGSVLAADDRYVVRFRPDGSIAWQTATPGGTPISPVITDSGIVVLATKGGPISAYRSTDGAFLGQLLLKANPGDTEFFETVNTPCVKGDRVYVSTQRTNDDAHTAWLAAVDVSEAALTEAWHFEFGGPSGGSPLRIGSDIYFDGDRVHPGDPDAPHVFGVRDDGTSPTTLFAVPVAGSIQASPAQDPRGGFWVFPTKTSLLLRLDSADGHELDRLNLDALVNAPGTHVPSSVMTIAGTTAAPVMLVSATPFDTMGATFVTAIDLSARSLLWKVKLANSRFVDWTAAQFAVAIDGATRKPRVFFPGFFSGVYAVGE